MSVENGEAALRAALRRWRRGLVAIERESRAVDARAAGRESEKEGVWVADGRSQAAGARIAVRESEAAGARVGECEGEAAGARAGEYEGQAEGARAVERGRWWPRLTRSQVQALLGAGITLGLLLWEQIRERLTK